MRTQLLILLATLVGICGCDGDDIGSGDCEDRYFESRSVEVRVTPASRAEVPLRPRTSPPPLPRLGAHSPEDSSVVLRWPTAVDLCTGIRATHYEVRFIESSQYVPNWNEMRPLPAILPDAGDRDNILRIEGLIPHTEYDFRFRGFYSEERSELSNVATAKTTSCVGTGPPVSHVFARSWELPTGSVPVDIEVDLETRLYVADWNAARILIYSAAGSLLGSWGESGTEPGQLGAISDLIFGHDRHLYVAEESGRLQRFTLDGQFLAEVIPAWSGGQRYHTFDEFAVDEGGNVFVSNRLDDNLFHYRADGLLLGSWPPKDVRRPINLRFGPVALGFQRYLFVLDTYRGDVNVYSTAGDHLRRWTNDSMCPTPLMEPVDIRWGWDASIYLLDSWNGQIRKIDPNGTVLSSWGRIGNGDGEFHEPLALAVGRGLSLFVLDRRSTDIPTYRIVVFERRSLS